VPVLAALVAVSLRMLLPDPGADNVAGVNAAVTPDGNPVADKLTGALKPPVTATVTVTLLFEPAMTETEVAERFAWNAGTIMPSLQ
jgi:hypothetical protein